LQRPRYPRLFRRHPHGRKRLHDPAARPRLSEHRAEGHHPRNDVLRRRLHRVGQEGLPHQHRWAPRLPRQRRVGREGPRDAAGLGGQHQERWPARRRSGRHRPGGEEDGGRYGDISRIRMQDEFLIAYQGATGPRFNREAPITFKASIYKVNPSTKEITLAKHNAYEYSDYASTEPHKVPNSILDTYR